MPSTSAEDEEKKQKKRKKESTFTVEVSNRFEQLSEDEMECPRSETFSGTPRTTTSKKIPPIVVHSQIKNELASLRAVAQSLKGELQIKAKGKKTIFFTQNIEDYNILKEKVERAKLEFHTYTFNQTKLPRMIIKNLPSNLPLEDIKEDLLNKNINFDKVTQMTKKIEEKIVNLPLFIVSFKEGVEIKTVLNIKTLCYYRITWEKFINKRPITQCYKCQDFNHLASNCFRTIKCRLCGEMHDAINCPLKQQTTRKCTNCSGPHPSNSVECPVYIKVLESKMTRARQAGPRSALPPQMTSGHHFPPLNRQAPPHPTTAPTWPNSSQPSAGNTNQTGSIFQDIKDLFQMLNLNKIKSCINQIVSVIKSPLDVTSKICIVVEKILDVISN